MHDDCLGSGGKCCNGFCCNEKYFNEIKNLECFSDDGCKVKILPPALNIRSHLFFIEYKIQDVFIENI